MTRILSQAMALVALVSSSALAQQTRAPWPVVVEGIVRTPEGAPAVGAQVSAEGGGVDVTGVDGSFRLPVELADGTRRVVLHAVDAGSGASLTRAVSVGATGTRGSRFLDAGVLSLASSVSGAPPGWLRTFGGSPGVQGSVLSLVVHDDGSGPALFAAGALGSAGGFGGRGVARWNGSSWSPFDDGLLGSIFLLNDMRALASFDPGSGPVLVAGGDSLIEQWDGTRWEIIGSIPRRNDNAVNALAVYDDGSGAKLYATGRFPVVNDVGGLHNIASWDGTSWAPLDGGLRDRNGNGFGVQAQALAVFDDASGAGPQLYVGGLLGQAGGVAALYLARWNGTSWSSVPGQPDGVIQALLVHDDGSGPALYATGLFTLAGGAPAANLARFDGTSWSTLGSGLNGRGYALATHDPGMGLELLVGGTFTVAGGVPAAGVARWNGSSWAALGSGLSGTCRSLASFDDGSGPRAMVGGQYLRAGGMVVNSIASFDGTGWSPLGNDPYVGTQIVALAVHDDGSGRSLFAGGVFTSADSGSVKRIGRWDGADWHALGSGVNNSVNALAVFDAGSGPQLYAGGAFTTAGGAPALRVARWDGSAWHPLGSGLNDAVNALCVFDDGGGPALYAGGAFTSAGGSPASRIARWNGSTWQALASGTDDAVRTLEVFDDGSGPALFVGGSFTHAGGLTAERIARWTGGGWRLVGSGFLFGGALLDLAVYDDGGGPALFACGDFSRAGGISARNIARWDGSDWSPLADGREYSVYSMVVFDDGSGSGPQLCVGGLGNPFASVANRMARWNGSKWSGFGSLMDDRVNALAVFDDGSGAGPALYAGGPFVGSIAGDTNLARWQGCADAEAPVIDCPPRVDVVDVSGSPPGEIVQFTVTAVDRDPFATLVCTPPSGSFFARGTTEVTCTATDASGNQAVCTFPVVVLPTVRKHKL